MQQGMHAPDSASTTEQPQQHSVIGALRERIFRDRSGLVCRRDLLDVEPLSPQECQVRSRIPPAQIS